MIEATTDSQRFALRCRRAAAMVWLARETGSAEREAEAMRLVIIECATRPGLVPSRVLSAANDILAAGGDVQATLIAELSRLADILGPVTIPDDDPGGTP